jgi:hypothetical protein
VGDVRHMGKNYKMTARLGPSVSCAATLVRAVFTAGPREEERPSVGRARGETSWAERR